MSRRSTCRASAHAAQVRVRTVGQSQHAWKSVAAMLAHGGSHPSRCPFPRSRPSHSPRSTYAARSQPSGGVLTPEVSSTLRDEDSMASAVSARRPCPGLCGAMRGGLLAPPKASAGVPATSRNATPELLARYAGSFHTVHDTRILTRLLLNVPHRGAAEAELSRADLPGSQPTDG